MGPRNNTEHQGVRKFSAASAQTSRPAGKHAKRFRARIPVDPADVARISTAHRPTRVRARNRLASELRTGIPGARYSREWSSGGGTWARQHRGDHLSEAR